MSDPTWFRTPAAGDPGTLNACYDALDIHVVRGRADDVALVLGGHERTFAWLLTEVAACAGVLRAFGVTPGDEVVVGRLPVEAEVLAVLASARVGAVVVHDAPPEASPAAGTVVVADLGEGPVFAVDGDPVPWEVALRAGRTDPAGCADVPGDALLARRGPDELSVLAAFGVAGHEAPTPPGARTVEVGGLRLWSFADA